MERRIPTILVSLTTRKAHDGDAEMDRSLTGCLVRCAGMALLLVGAALSTTAAQAQVLAMTFEHRAGRNRSGRRTR